MKHFLVKMSSFRYDMYVNLNIKKKTISIRRVGFLKSYDLKANGLTEHDRTEYSVQMYKNLFSLVKSIGFFLLRPYNAHLA